jgi:heat shock protein HslJ
LASLLLVTLLSACSGINPTNTPQLEGKTWVLTTYNDTQPIDGRQPILQFEADQVSGTTGCNHYGSAYQIGGNAIRFEGVFSTEMACLEPEGLMDQERIYLDSLSS